MNSREFARAHDQYLTPPDCPEERTKECGECGGCGTLTDEQGTEDICHVCKGEGKVVMTQEEIWDEENAAQEEAQERRMHND